MKKLLQEFKTFALRGNVMELAVGVLIGGAFQGIVSSLTENIINPILGLFGGVSLDQYVLKLGDASLNYGAFIASVINFLIMAFMVFILVKTMNHLASIGKKPETPTLPATKPCPYCCSEISVNATRCPHCTSIIDQEDTKDDV